MHVMCVSVYGYSMRTCMGMCMYGYVHARVWVWAVPVLAIFRVDHSHAHIHTYIHLRTANCTWCVPYFHPPFWGEGGGGGGGREYTLHHVQLFSVTLQVAHTHTCVCGSNLSVCHLSG